MHARERTRTKACTQRSFNFIDLLSYFLPRACVRLLRAGACACQSKRRARSFSQPMIFHLYFEKQSELETETIHSIVITDESPSNKMRGKASRTVGESENDRVHCGTKPGRLRRLIIHFPMSLGVNERASKQMCERCEWTCERMSKWPSTSTSTYVSILGYSEPLSGGWWWLM